jgi:hypothetical protein
MSYPRCFDSLDQFKGWVGFARQSAPPPGHEYCHDCTEEYQSKMITQGRCEYPGTIFVISVRKFAETNMVEHEYHGMRPFKDVKKLRDQS